MERIGLNAAIEEYLVHCRARGLADSTIVSKRHSLRVLERTIGSVGVWTLSHRAVDSVFTKHPSWMASTRNKHLAHYQAFFTWCRSRGFMGRDTDPAFGYRPLRVPNPEKLRVPLAEWPRLFNACETEIERIVIATGLYLFLRASEQRLIQIRHVHLDDLEIEIFRRKGQEWDTMPIPLELAPYIRAHLTWYGSQFDLKPDYFFIPTYLRPTNGSNGQFLKGRSVINPNRPFILPHRFVQRVLERAGYPTYFQGEHTLRRSGARAYFDALVEQGYDGSLRRVQAMLGHRRSDVTERYLGLDLDRRRRNQDLKGRPMFPALLADNVVHLKKDA